MQQKSLSPEVEVTRSLSNLIKYPFVNLEGKEAFIINHDKDDDGFEALDLGAEKISEENGEDGVNLVNEQEELLPDSQFEPGMNVINGDAILEEERAKCRIQARKIVDDANEQADFILSQAREESEHIKEESFQKGYNEGFQKGEDEAKGQYNRLETELNEKIEHHEKEYNEMIDDIEPRYVKVIISLIQKITGVLMEDRDDLIIYLIKNSIGNLDKSAHYTFRISGEDSFIVESHKKEIKEILGEDVSVEYIEEKDLKKDECIIETDNQMVDCGLKTQLDNLIETLKMMR